MKPVFASIAATAAILCVGAVIVMSFGSVRQVEADRQSAAAQRVADREAEAGPDDGPGSPVLKDKPDARHERVLRYEAATSGSQDQAAAGVSKTEGKLERVEPLPQPSRFGEAQPQKPPLPGEWKETTLFQPVATAAGTIKAKGYTIAVAGIEPVGPDETCDSAGRSWPCGARARAAFRAFLRGRAISCMLPPQPEQAALATECAVGKTDIGGWLVSNGWARARADGPLAKEAEEAKAAKKGIYGEAPVLTAPSAAEIAPGGLPAPPASSASILDGSATDPTALGSTAPIVVAPFPPAPAPFTPPAAPPAPAQ